MKIFLAALLVAVIAFFTQTNDQAVQKATLKKRAASFSVYIINERFGPKTTEYFKDHRFKFATLQTQGSIVQRDNKSVVDLARVERFLDDKFPKKDSAGILVLDWESEPFKNLRIYNASDSRFRDAENQWVLLVREVKRLRPQVKVGFYGLPFRSYHDWQKVKFNQPGKLNKLLSEVDFIAPSLYIMYADEAVGRDRNLQYLRDNLDVALQYGKELGKPVIPFVWHRVHYSDNIKGQSLIPKEAFATYVDYIGSYVHNNNQVSGVLWWDYASNDKRIKNITTVKDPAEYDSLMREYASTLVKELKY
ncbi:hypothetical protein [Pontibacter liquoris]|uniref:hypothetical protein n=1 Tax=Pontibacter liquoris TaxID=2905677 RepID=UPI001FA7E641|nr:hypothetical protein [Pontibacter liquoris]